MATIVVEANANIAVTNTAGKIITITGVTAIERELVERNLTALPETTLRVLDRDPSEGEVHSARRRGLIRRAAPAPAAVSKPDDSAEPEGASPFDAVPRGELLSMAKRVGVPGKGKSVDIIAAIEDLAAAASVTIEGSAEHVIASIEEAMDT